MSSSQYEILMLPDGEVVLQRSDVAGEPLVRITFSDEAKYFLGEASMDVARAMIDAGIELVEQLGAEGQLDEGEATKYGDRVLH